MPTSDTATPKTPARKYSEQERNELMVAVALRGSRRIADVCKELGIPKETMTSWMYDSHREDYRKIQKDTQPKVRDQAISEALDTFFAAKDTTEELRKRMMAKVDEIPARDLPGAYRNAGTVMGISADKARQFMEQQDPSTPSLRNFQDIMRSLKGKNIELRLEVSDKPQTGGSIDGEATEVPLRASGSASKPSEGDSSVLPLEAPKTPSEG